MGFERGAVINSLNANNGDEMAALNGLLSGAPAAPNPTSNSNQPSSAPPQQNQTQSAGVFGRIWGK